MGWISGPFLFTEMTGNQMRFFTANQFSQFFHCGGTDILDRPEAVQQLVGSFFTNPVDSLQFVFKSSLASFLPVKGDAEPVYLIPNTPDEF